jgi:hypothetical protein
VNKITGSEHAVKVVKVEGNALELKKEASHMLECKTPFIVSCDGFIDKGDEIWVREYPYLGPVPVTYSSPTSDCHGVLWRWICVRLTQTESTELE